MKKTIFVLLATLTLAGCYHNPPAPIVQKEYVTFELDQKLLTPCAISKPPVPDKFAAMNLEEQRLELFIFSTKTLGELKKCNSQMEKISRVYDNHVARMKALKEAEQTGKVKQ